MCRKRKDKEWKTNGRHERGSFDEFMAKLLPASKQFSGLSCGIWKCN